ncbi:MULTISPECIES: PAAR domain-containing protein [unclassified Psychrobacter]|uniref:PAAR domain-containing protein n=2 Tax=unclassified Psychrobacter TaxID=196806 RepID=UPI001787B4DF|nr:PAAR domain-containing protein [Psychrobacter sp. FME6]MBE0407294.1 PAAR domain-containing protein [Psychrobacter sp. FME6]
MAAYITVGAKTSHGGTVISGSPHTTHNGIPISRIGDKVICKKCKKVTTILSGDASFIVDGAPIARGGDVTSCGAKLIASQQSFAESGFDVGSIAQAAPLAFPKSEPEALFGNSFVEDDEEEPEEVHFSIEFIEFSNEGGYLDSYASEDDFSNIAVDEYNNEGDYLGSYDLADKPSNLSASTSGFGNYNPSNPNMKWDPDMNRMMPNRTAPKNNGVNSNLPWYKQNGNKNKAIALADEIGQSMSNSVHSTAKSYERRAGKLAKETVEVAKHTQNAMIVNLGIIEAGFKDFPERTKASAATAMLRFGQRSNVDFIYIAGGAGVKHFGIDIGMSVNVHNGNVYEPVIANANLNTNKAPSISVQVGVGRIISSNTGDNVKATDAILSGQGHSYSVEVGPASAAIETTNDGTTVAGSGGFGKSWTVTGSNGSSTMGASKGSTNMEL